MRTVAAVAALLSAATMAAAQGVVTVSISTYTSSNNVDSMRTPQIQVGAEASTAGGIFQFLPPNVTATNGTVINFVWKGSPGNHTVTQSSADAPCQPLSSGFDSGFLFIPANTTNNFPEWNVTITNDQERELNVTVYRCLTSQISLQQSTSTARSSTRCRTAARSEWLGTCSYIHTTSLP